MRGAAENVMYFLCEYSFCDSQLYHENTVPSIGISVAAEEEFSSADWTAHEIQSQRAQAGPARHAGEKFIDGGEPG